MLKAKKVLVTAGPTHEYLDDIRLSEIEAPVNREQKLLSVFISLRQT